jgi:hypothetical protein
VPIVFLAVNPTAIDATRLAFAHAKRLLLHPFRLGQWMRLAFVGALAGEMGGGGCNFRVPADLVRPRAQHLQSPDLFGGQPLLMIAAVAAAVVLAMMLAVAFLYVSSRMRFVLSTASWRRSVVSATTGDNEASLRFATSCGSSCLASAWWLR